MLDSSEFTKDEDNKLQNNQSSETIEENSSENVSTDSQETNNEIDNLLDTDNTQA